MDSTRIRILVRLGLFDLCVYDITWLAQLDADEADEVFSVRVGALVWAD